MAFINIMEIVYPVGTIYMSTRNISPASLYGGSWVELTDGKFLLPRSDWNTVGGTNKISIEHIPPHSHPVVDILGSGWNSGVSGDKIIYGSVLAGRSVAEFFSIGNTGGGGKLFASLPHLFCLVQDSIKKVM